MSLVQLIPMMITVSIVLTVAVIGLAADLRDAMWLFGQPGLLVRSILALNVIMVALAAAVVAAFDLDQPTAIAIIALAASPLPPILPNKLRKAGGSDSYAVGLLVAAAVVSIVLTPAAVELAGGWFGADAHVTPARIMIIVTVTTLAPLLAGLLVRQFAPGVAERMARPLGLVAMVLLVAAVLPLLWTMSGAIWAAVGNGTLVALAAFTLVGLALGHGLGGPDPDTRTDLALAAGVRHPGIAMAIAGAAYPEQKGAVLAVVLLHLIVAAIVGIPYVRSRKRSASVPGAGEQAGSGAHHG